MGGRGNEESFSDYTVVYGEIYWMHRTLTVGGCGITVRLVFSLTSLDSTASLHTNKQKKSFLVKSNLVQLETSWTVILPLQLM